MVDLPLAGGPSRSRMRLRISRRSADEAKYSTTLSMVSFCPYTFSSNRRYRGAPVSGDSYTPLSRMASYTSLWDRREMEGSTASISRYSANVPSQSNLPTSRSASLRNCSGLVVAVMAVVGSLFYAPMEVVVIASPKATIMTD